VSLGFTSFILDFNIDTRQTSKTNSNTTRLRQAANPTHHLLLPLPRTSNNNSTTHHLPAEASPNTRLHQTTRSSNTSHPLEAHPYNTSPLPSKHMARPALVLT
jgi:hypothetical protein